MNQAPHHESESHALLCLRNHNKAPLGGERSARLRGIPNGIAALLTVPFFLCMAVFACLLNLANDVTAQEKPAAEAKASEKTADEKKPATTEQPAATKPILRAKPIKTPVKKIEAKAAPSLPPGYIPPVELPKGSSSDEEWIVPMGKGDKKTIRKILSRYRGDMLRRSQVNTPKDRELFVEIVRWKLSQLTLRENLTDPEKQQEIGKMRKSLLDDVRDARKAGGKSYTLLMETLIAETPKLFKYHFISRINGAWLLAELNEQEEERNPRFKAAVPYIPAAAPLLDLLKQQDQLDAVRIPAVDGLTRIIANAQTTAELDAAIIAVFLNELETGDPKHEFLASKIAHSLGMLGIVDDKTRRPVVVQVLTQTLADKRRPYRVRCECAQALGRLPLNNTINAKLISYKIVELAAQMTAAMQKQKSLTPVAWKTCFWKLYFAFNGDTKENIAKQHGLTRKSFGSAAKKSVQDAYAQVLPIVIAVIDEKKTTPENLKTMQEWLKESAPENKKVHENFKEIISTR